METDDLSTPLGQAKKKKSRKLPFAAPQIVAALLALCGLVVVGWAALVDDPLGGEPVVVVATGLAGASGSVDKVDSDGTEHSRHDGTAMNTPAMTRKKDDAPPGSKTVTIIDGSSGAREDVVIPGNGASMSQRDPDGKTSDNPKRYAVLIDRDLIGTSRHGAVPKVGPHGERAATVYAQPRTLPPDRQHLPRIAIVIGAVGISASGTADAMSMLPAAVTFSIAPYGTDVAKLAEHVRTEGHEILLQVPMEPFDYPDNDPGPQTLLTSLTGEQNVDRLHWLMSRFQGYVGIESFMGARFTASEQALKPVLQEIGKRGLIFVDGTGSTRSVSAQVAGGLSLPFGKADVVIDAVPKRAEIDHALARLELAARESGSAVGYATAQPATIERIAAWAKKIESRGFVLVPISMVALKSKST